MVDAWIYTEDRQLGGELARELAELGYSPRCIRANGSLCQVPIRATPRAAPTWWSSRPAPVVRPRSL